MSAIRRTVMTGWGRSQPGVHVQENYAPRFDPVSGPDLFATLVLTLHPALQPGVATATWTVTPRREAVVPSDADLLLLYDVHDHDLLVWVNLIAHGARPGDTFTFGEMEATTT